MLPVNVFGDTIGLPRLSAEDCSLLFLGVLPSSRTAEDQLRYCVVKSKGGIASDLRVNEAVTTHVCAVSSEFEM